MVNAIAAIMEEASAPFNISEVEIDQPQAGEVLVDIQAVGICHTDLALGTGAFGTQFPAIFGHEGAGVVLAVGDNVTKVKSGDKVLLTFNSCGSCHRCEDDDPSYCTDWTALNLISARPDGSSRVSRNGEKVSDNFFGQSSFASKTIAHERNVVRLAQDADPTPLAPLGCSIQTGVGGVVNSLEAKAGQSLIVFGGGAVGLSAIIGGVIAGCSPIILVEPQAERRAIALELGADHVCDPLSDDPVEFGRKISPDGLDLVVDTSGAEQALASCVGLLANKGKIGLLGLPADLEATFPVPIVQWLLLGGTVRGIAEGDSNPDVFIPQLIEHYNKGELPIDKFVTRYPFEKINEAIDDLHNGKAIKAILVLPSS